MVGYLALGIMLNRNKRINKKQYKRSAGMCRICKDDRYVVMDVHRIIPGRDGGKYTEANSVPICCKCHRLLDDGTIVIDRWYPSTAGYVLRIIENGVERFV